MRRRRQGFTLVEILVTLMLIAIVIPVIMKGISLGAQAASDAKRRTEAGGLAQEKLAEILASKLKPPFGVVLGAPGEVAELAGTLPSSDVTCYQMDLFQADRLRVELKESGHFGEVVTAPDLWDLPAPLQTLVYPVPLGGERGLKLDMIEQGFHALQPGGTFAVLSPYEKEEFFPQALNQVAGVFRHDDGDRNLFFTANETE